MSAYRRSARVFRGLGATSAVFGTACLVAGLWLLVNLMVVLPDLPPSERGFAAVLGSLWGLWVLGGAFLIVVGLAAVRRPENPPRKSLSVAVALMFLIGANLVVRMTVPPPGNDAVEQGRAFFTSVLILVVAVILYAVVRRWLGRAADTADGGPG